MKKIKKLLFVGAFAFIASCGSSETGDTAKSDNTTDSTATESANSFKESIYNGSKVKIGNQIWMAENLNVDVFSNGEPIPEAKTAKEWNDAAKNEKPAWCYYDNDAENGKKFGKLYNWFAVSDPRGLAPKGWHVSSHEECIALSAFVGSPVGKKIKNDSGWDLSGWTESNGDNSYGFNGLPGGCRSDDGTFLSLNGYGYFWTSTENNITTAHGRSLAVYDDIDRKKSSKGSGLTVRCIKDK